MKRTVEIKQFILEALQGCSGEPLPKEALVAQTQLALPHLRLTEAEIQTAIDELVDRRCVLLTADEVLEQSLYTLLPKGEAAIARRR